jgi:uncharacterized protein
VSRAALLDVNVLVALFDADHVHHELAHDWFAENRAQGWATCPTTENGFVRVVANPSYGGPLNQPSALLELLRKFCRTARHEFWPDSLSLQDETVFNREMVAGHRQITDIYLLGLARRHGGRLATFDRAVPARAVKGGSAALEVISALDA